MIAKQTLVSNLLNGARQFRIPIYQRPYSWNEPQCRQLFDDVVRVAQSEENHIHFMGSVVYVEGGDTVATAVTQLLVIDGQQRLTTVSLVVEALARSIEAQEEGASQEVTPRKLRNYFLFNAEEDGDQRFKLVLSLPDDETLRALLRERDLPPEHSRRLQENLELFQEWIGDCELSPGELYRGLSRLMVVEVALDRTHDNPQLIFESLNSTGLDLSQADLVRNYVLMGLEPSLQTELYERHWAPMERLLGEQGGPATFDHFLRAWLTLRTGEVHKTDRGYEVF